MFFVYILKSFRDNKRYIGHTNNIARRLSEHNNGECIATKNRRPFELLYYETVENKSKAMKRETFFKSGKGREYIEKVLKR